MPGALRGAGGCGRSVRKLLANAGAFLSFLGSYNVFIHGAVIIIVNYILRNGNIHVPPLYNPSKIGLYWFWSGVNYLAVLAWIAGVALGLRGCTQCGNIPVAEV
ncbi:hypothetical protein BDW62DRAFT_203686 [Aspergillus aurantiobrunneus]